MATSIYLGMPPPKIKEWIEKNYTPDMTKVPLTFTAEEPNAKLSLISDSSITIKLETSTTGEEGSWTPYTIGSELILENVGDKIMFRNSSNDIQPVGSVMGFYRFDISSGKIAASGNIMFLMDKAGELRDITNYDYCFCQLFMDCTSLTQAPELPATTLANECYDNMFSGCTMLSHVPKIATIDCCNWMFYGCKSPLIFSYKTYEEVSHLIQYKGLLGNEWNEDEFKPVVIKCSDKTLLATPDQAYYEFRNAYYLTTWIITENNK